MMLSRKVVAFSAVVESATGVAFIAIPGLAGQLLLGAQLPPRAIVVARCFGVALLALSLAVWPGNDAGSGRSAIRALLVYNALIALYLTWLGWRWHMGGTLLWPAAALHFAVALLLGWSLTSTRGSPADSETELAQ